MTTLNGANRRTQQLVTTLRQATTGQDSNRQFFQELEAGLLSATLAEKMAWLDEQIILCGDNEDLAQFFTDWRDFLRIKNSHDPLLQVWDNENKCYRNPDGQIYSDIHKRRGWEGWTGAGLPPQLQRRI